MRGKEEGHCVYCDCCRQWLTPAAGVSPRPEERAASNFGLKCKLSGHFALELGARDRAIN